MVDVNKKLLHCYNKGCGKTFDPEENPPESCIFHSGEPYFHDAYKEWTCCKRKSTDFTEFLNFKGCIVGSHNGTRPSLNKPKIQKEDYAMKEVEKTFVESLSTCKDEKYEDVAPDLPLMKIKPEISARLLQQISALKSIVKTEITDGKIPIGTSCKNTGCSVSYEEGINEDCVHHPGSAVFHEGLKYWSCCKKITSDFSKFLDQAGCTTGKHVWLKEKEAPNCRVDWHQTSGKVEVSIYAKNYDPEESFVSLSPTRMNVNVRFVQDDVIFEKNYELGGIVKVEESCVSMLPTKIEIKLAKARTKNWIDLSKS